MTDQAPRTPRSDDAEIRGEHDFTPQRDDDHDDAAAPTAEHIRRQRKQGQYAAGADGTQHVSGHPVPPRRGESKIAP